MNDSIIRNFHREYFSPFVSVGFEYYAGNYRCVDPQMPCLNSNIVVGILPGVDVSLVTGEMFKLSKDFNDQTAILVRRWKNKTATTHEITEAFATIIAKFIARFLQIHPFLNGNGRTSRVLWAWCFQRFGLNPMIGYEVRPGQPYSIIMEAAMNGHWLPLAQWIILHLTSCKLSPRP